MTAATFSTRVAALSLICAGAAFSQAAGAEPAAIGAWRIAASGEAGARWCAAKANYAGGKRLSVYAARGGYALSVTDPAWAGVADGLSMIVTLRTDAGWAASYRAATYIPGGETPAGGVMTPAFEGAIAALANAGSMTLETRTGQVLAALDLTDSAAALDALKACDAAETASPAAAPPEPAAQVAPTLIDPASEPETADARDAVDRGATDLAAEEPADTGPLAGPADQAPATNEAGAAEAQELASRDAAELDPTAIP